MQRTLVMMSTRFTIVILWFFISNFLYGQNSNIGQFVIWKPKDGQLQNFENGYKQHLQWHSDNDDKWSWYGWFFISGPRSGQFIDATFDHTWADFDQAVKPAADRADNRLHVFPFGEIQAIFKVANQLKASTVDSFALKLNLIRFITLTVNDVDEAMKVSEKLKDFYFSKNIKTFKTFKVIDGDHTNQIIIMMGFSNWEDYAISETLTEKVSETQKALKIKPIELITSETMLYRPDMSLFPTPGPGCQ